MEDIENLTKEIHKINSNINIHLGKYEPININEFNINSGAASASNSIRSALSNSIFIPDATVTSGIPNNAIKIGDATNGDLMIYHDSNNSVIRDAGTGSLIFQSNQIAGYRYGTSERLFQFVGNGAASLYYGGASTAKLATTSYGITVNDGDSGFTSTYNARVAAVIELSLIHIS